MNAETVLRILEIEKRDVVYRRPLDVSLYIVLSLACLRLFYLDREGAGANLVLWRFYSNGRKAAARPPKVKFVEEGAFANFLSNWSALYRERRWKEVAPTLGEVARIVNAYAMSTGYFLFTVGPEEPLSAAEPYAPSEIEEMHEATGYDS